MKTNPAWMAWRASVIGLVLGSALPGRADTTNTYGNAEVAYQGKDAGIGLYAEHGCKGSTTSIRAGKGYRYDNLKNFAIFDWNRASIVTNLEGWARTNGWSGLQEAYQHGAVKVEFAIRVSSGLTEGDGKALRVGFFNSETAWADGNGYDQDTNYNWDTNTAAVTASYAVDWRPGDTGAQTPTKWRDNGTDRNYWYELSVQYNSAVLTNMVPNTYNYVTLDPTLWWNYLHSTKAGAGLNTAATTYLAASENISVYSRKAGTASCPRLRVTITKRRPPGLVLMLMEPDN